MSLPEAGEEEEGMSAFTVALYLFILLIMVVSLYFVSYFDKYLHYIPESVLIIVLGAVVGGIIQAINVTTKAEPWNILAFDPHMFFLFILPPIIFDSAYRIPPAFYKNLGAILLFAVVGTIVSTIIVGGVLAALSRYTKVLPAGMAVPDSMAFGSLISAVDPVAALAIFSQLHADETLYVLVFGESLLNDAMAVTLFRTFNTFEGESLTGMLVLTMLKNFVVSSLVSLAIGGAIGVITALLFKHLRLFKQPAIELGVFFLLAFQPYYICEGLGYSGIMALLMCAIILNRFVRPSLSPRAVVVTSNLSHLLAFILESLIFLYLGMVLWSHPIKWSTSFFFITLGLIIAGRALNVYPLTFLLNLYRKRKNTAISWQITLVQFYSGLRGAIAFALSLSLNSEAAGSYLTTTLFITLFTIVVFGTTTGPLLQGVKMTGSTQKKSPQQLLDPANSQAPSAPCELAFSSVDNAPVVSLDVAVAQLDREDHDEAQQLAAAGALDKEALEGVYIPGVGAVRSSSNAGDAAHAAMPNAINWFEQKILRPFLIRGENFHMDRPSIQGAPEVQQDAVTQEALRIVSLISAAEQVLLPSHTTIHGSDPVMGVSVLPSIVDAASVGRPFLHLPTRNSSVLDTAPPRSSVDQRTSIERRDLQNALLQPLGDPKSAALTDVKMLPLLEQFYLTHSFTINEESGLNQNRLLTLSQMRRRLTGHSHSTAGLDYIEQFDALQQIRKAELLQRANDPALSQLLTTARYVHKPGVVQPLPRSRHMGALDFFAETQDSPSPMYDVEVPLVVNSGYATPVHSLPRPRRNFAQWLSSKLSSDTQPGDYDTWGVKTRGRLGLSDDNIMSSADFSAAVRQ